ncbi:MAG TPA: DUF5715 family protein [Streptosporangiaceae bacterium]|nr:DUF5715 family protein [Streptosporangiaceae bacterium]
MTIWLAGEPGPAPSPDEPAQLRGPDPDLAAYRSAVTDLVASLERSDAAASPRLAARILARRLADPDIAAVIDRTRQGSAGVLERLLLEVRTYRPTARSSAASLTALLRISLLAQIDALWWGRQEPYPTDAAVLSSDQLLDLDALREGGLLRFRYRHQAASLVARAGRSLERRALPARAPMTAGVWLARARPAAVALLNHIATQFAERAPRGTPPLWVTSLARSVEHQRRLRALGYTALLPSSHCVGYAADVEMTWFRRFGAHRALQEVLLDWQRSGDVNVIDEGQAWHVCLRPGVSYGSRLVPAPQTEG